MKSDRSIPRSRERCITSPALYKKKKRERMAEEKERRGMADAVNLSTPSHLTHYGTCANCEEAYRPNLCLEREADMMARNKPLHLSLVCVETGEEGKEECRRADRIRRRWEHEKRGAGFSVEIHE